MSKCRGCGAEIIWIATPGGKKMPCDPDQVVYWPPSKTDGRCNSKIVTPNGEVLSCRMAGEVSDAIGVGYKPHWASCPQANAFKKKEK